jgi:hypothetical protein
LRALLLLCLLAALAAAGCGGDDDASGGDDGTGPLTVEDRVLQEGELSGYTPKGTAQAETDASAFVDSVNFFFPASDEAIAELEGAIEDAGFVSGAYQYLPGSSEKAGAAGSLVVQVGSEAEAKALARQAFDATLEPCKDDCSIDYSEFDVEGVPGALGSGRVRSDENASGDVEPFESYHVFFADGPFVYALYAAGRPGGVDSGDVADAARAQYERVAGRPAPAE